ncbi:MAG: replication-associated recombination protein A [Acidimicrobiales bacterium]
MADQDDLFAASLEERLRERAPLAARLRPRTLDEVLGQRHLVGPNAPLRVLAEADRLGSAILWGPPGSGKTTLARVLSSMTAKTFVPLSAVESGVRDIRSCLDEARGRMGEQGRGTMLFVDEVHRFNKAQQDVLLPAVEDGLVVLIGATTENPFFEVNAPLMSRSTLWRLHPIGDAELALLVDRGLAAEEASADAEVVEALVAGAHGDARALLTMLEVAVAIAASRVGEGPHDAEDGGPSLIPVVMDDVRRGTQGRLFHQGRDAHFDQISALIKSVRGSDPDAGLYWLARMIEAGEDPLFIARRLVILASEDVGMADSQGLVIAVAAARAVETVGLPEGALALSHAIVYLASAPKSNRVTVALSRAQEDVRSGSGDEVPVHLRDAHYRGAEGIGHGVGYRYPHDDPRGWVDQQYRPADVEGHAYFVPSAHGEEQMLGERRRYRGAS